MPVGQLKQELQLFVYLLLSKRMGRGVCYPEIYFYIFLTTHFSWFLLFVSSESIMNKAL